jgi:hypothetical protein
MEVLFISSGRFIAIPANVLADAPGPDHARQGFYCARQRGRILVAASWSVPHAAAAAPDSPAAASRATLGAT